MKLKDILLTVAAMAALITPSIAQDDDETPLEKEMSVINKPYKTLGRALRKDEIPFDDLVPQVEAAIAAGKKAAELVPALLEKESDAAKKEAAVKKYKEMSEKMTKGFDELLVALKAKDKDKTKAAYDALKQLKKDGHNEFIEE